MRYGKTEIVLCEDVQDLGRRAAAAVAEVMRRRLASQPEVRMILAAGESQMTFLDALAVEPGIAWERVVCFNMDDFWHPGLPREYTCGWQVQRQLYDKVNPKRVELVRFNAPDPEAEARRFGDLLAVAQPMDILCQGIGTSGHLALDEPGQCDFETRVLVKVADVDEQSKRQLREDPNFQALGFIPDKGITMTIPAMLAARHLFTIVPLGLKRPILARVLATSVPTTALPASILSRYEGLLFLDRDSCPAEHGGRAGGPRVA